MEQRHLGVQVHSFLKVATQVDWEVKNVFTMHFFIGQGTKYRSGDLMVQGNSNTTFGVLCTVLATLLLEDDNKLEKVQKTLQCYNDWRA